MKNYVNILGYLCFGVLCIFLFQPGSGSYYYAVSDVDSHTVPQARMSLKQDQQLPLLAFDSGLPLDKCLRDRKEQNEMQEENIQHPVYGLRNKVYTYLQQLKAPSYKDTLLTISQPKRYLLFQHLKIAC